jgi:hypothetical protein
MAGKESSCHSILKYCGRSQRGVGRILNESRSRLALAVRRDNLEASPSEHDLAIPYFLDVDRVLTFTLEWVSLVEGFGIKPFDLDLTSFAYYWAYDLGGEREGSVDACPRRQATFRAKDRDGALAKADILPLTPCYNSTGKELTELTGIGHVDP